MRRFADRFLERARSVGRLGQALIVTGILGLIVPLVAFLVQEDEFTPEETREHIDASLERVRRVKGVYQQIENKLEEAESKTHIPGEPLTPEEERAIEQLGTGGRSKWHDFLSFRFLQIAAACLFFLLAGVAIERYHLTGRRAPPIEGPPAAPGTP